MATHTKSECIFLEKNSGTAQLPSRFFVRVVLKRFPVNPKTRTMSYPETGFKRRKKTGARVPLSLAAPNGFTLIELLVTSWRSSLF